MTAQFGEYRLAIHRRPRDWQASLEKGLSGLVTLLDKAPCPWYLVGGVGTDLCYGPWTRPHHDIDIECELGDAPALVPFLNSQGYDLVCPKIRAKLNDRTRVGLYQQVRVDELRVDKQFRLLRKDTATDFLSYIDISFMRKSNAGVTFGYHGTKMALAVMYEYGREQKYGIRLRNPAIHLALKTRTSRRNDAHDVLLLHSLTGGG